MTDERQQGAPSPTSFQLWTGEWFDILEPDPALITAETLAKPLGNIARFGGHIDEHYSVAQHSVLVAKMLEDDGEPPMIVLAGLLHDAAEALGLGDIIAPAKTAIGFPVRKAEYRLHTAVEEAFALPQETTLDYRIKQADYRAYFAETAALRGPEFLDYATDDQQDQAGSDANEYRLFLKPTQAHVAAEEWLDYVQEMNR